MELLNKDVLILGEGISGMGAFDALEGIAARMFYYDGCLTKVTPDLVVISPGIANHPALDFARHKGIPVISELELGYLLNRSPICAVTGTNGKTTVTRMIGEMTERTYKTIVCGNIGVAFSAAAKKPHSLAVVECSSFQLLDCHEFCPQIAVITGITPDHLDRHKTMDEYAAAKMRMVKNQTKDDFLIAPAQLGSLCKKLKSSVLYLGLDVVEKNSEIYFCGRPIASLDETNLIGEHNRQNALSAAAAAKLLGIEDDEIALALKEFRPDPHRLALVSNKHNKRWFDDSKATNIHACLAACHSMRGSTALLLGGSDKGYEYDELFKNLPANITDIFVFGAIKDKLTAAALRTKTQVNIAANLLEAVIAAQSTNALNVLLSPAAASFDNFQNYAQRGRAFLDAINQI